MTVQPLYHGQTRVDTAYIHCAYTRPNWMETSTAVEKVAEIRRWHVEENGWNGFGYHFFIDRDGTLVEGRPLETIGAHVQGHNRGSIGICLAGGHGGGANDEFSDHFTPEQEDALLRLLHRLKTEHGVKKVKGHNDVAARGCPCFKVERWLKGKPSKRKVYESRTVQGGAAAATGTVGAALAEQAEALEPLIGISDTVRWVFIGLTLLGVAYALYARLDDYRKGRT